MLERPAVSVILPCYNDAAHIGAAISSLRDQILPDFEALVIDDGSDDDSAARASDAIDGDTRFRLLRQPHAGLSAARNHGLDVARSAFIAFLDADDQFAPRFLHDHLHEIVASGADWTACAVTLVWPDGRAFAHSALHGAPVPEGNPRWLGLEDARNVARLFPSVWNKLYRRSFIGHLRFREGALFEDHPFFWQLACRSGRIRYLPQPLYCYRQGRPGQITARADAGILQQLDRLEEVCATVRASSLTGQRAGLSMLASRVIHERLEKDPTPALRAQFLTQARGVLARQDLGWTRGGADDIDPAPAPALDPEFRLSVLVSGPDARAAGPKTQHLPLAQVITAREGPLMALLQTHLAQTDAAWITLLRAGDHPRPDWALACLGVARDHSLQDAPPCAAVVCTPLAAALSGGAFVPMPGMVILRRTVLADWFGAQPQLARALTDLPDPVALACLLAHLAAQSHAICHQPAPLIDAPYPALSLHATAQTLAQMPQTLCPLPPRQRAAIFAHLAQMRMAQGRTRPARLAIALAAGLARRSAGLPAPPAADHLGRYLQVCLGCRGA